MTQTLLKDKVARYLAYATDRAWDGRRTLIPRPDPNNIDDYHAYFHTPDECRFCGGGRRIDYARRGEVPTLAQRLAAIRARLRG